MDHNGAYTLRCNNLYMFAVTRIESVPGNYIPFAILFNYSSTLRVFGTCM